MIKSDQASSKQSNDDNLYTTKVINFCYKIDHHVCSANPENKMCLFIIGIPVFIIAVILICFFAN